MATNSVINSNQSLSSSSSPTFSAMTVKNLISTPVALTPGASVSTDASLSMNFTLTLNQNTTLANPTNLTSGVTYAWIITQDSTARTLGFGNAFTWPGGVSPTVSTGSGAIDIITGYYDGTKLRAVYSQAFA